MPVSSPRLLPGAPDAAPDTSDASMDTPPSSGDIALPSEQPGEQPGEKPMRRRRRQRDPQQPRQQRQKRQQRQQHRESDDRAMSSRGPRDARPSRGGAAPGNPGHADGGNRREEGDAGSEELAPQSAETPQQRSLREWRIARGMTQQQVAFASGLGITTVRDIEREKRAPSIVTAHKLVRALGVTTEQVRWLDEHAGSHAEPASPEGSGEGDN